ncbi:MULTISPECIES: sensor histidine kinase [unclassified Streptomyces]|uniref:sensor histidine kinase n=1 Tax=unclassified Streptomyces TaxID=2593676 RepID=UPI002E17222C
MNTDLSPRLGAWQQTWRLLTAAGVGAVAWLYTGVAVHWQGGGTGTWFLVGDPLVALGCLAVLLWRRRFPLAVAVTVVAAATVSAAAAGAALWALGSVATRRRPLEIGAVVLAYVTGAQFTDRVYAIRTPEGSWWLEIVLPALAAGIAVAVGMAIGARRVEVRSLRDRAHSMEREHAARVAQVRAVERNRIAREMHDVLAHRISLVALQAGALDHRVDLAAEENRTLVRGIADGSRQALEELRDVLGVLRADPAGPEPPQPSLDRIPDLVADARSSGVDVDFTTTVTGHPPDALGRTCYRFVQEGLTNAAKHAPGARVHITLDGTPGDTLHVSVRNSRATTGIAPPPSSGYGLLGLGERITLAGGELDHHPTSDHGYVLTARLPWPNAKHHGERGHE